MKRNTLLFSPAISECRQSSFRLRSCLVDLLRFGKSFAAKMKDKQSPDAIRDYGGDVLLVGINYDTEKKMHESRIERLDSECTM